MSISPENQRYQIKIDGVAYNVAITSLKRKADILDKSAYRTEDGILHREVIGTYYNYTLGFGMCCRTKEDRQVYNRLFEVLSEPTAYHIVQLPHDNVSYKAYFSSVTDEVEKLVEDGTGAKYKGLTCNCTAVEPRRRA